MTDNTPTIEWTAIPAPPKVPNFHQSSTGYTLHYGSPGWDVHAGTHDAKDTLGEVLFHAKTAKDAKAWVEQQPAPGAEPKPKRAAKAKAKAAPQPEEDAEHEPAPDAAALAARRSDAELRDVLTSDGDVSDDALEAAGNELHNRGLRVDWSDPDHPLVPAVAGS